MNLGKRIEHRLEELGWRRVDLVKRVPALTPQSLSALITRDSKRSDYDIEIAEALGVTVNWLVNGTGEKLVQNHPHENSVINIPLDPVTGDPRTAAILPVHDGLSLHKKWVDVAFPELSDTSKLTVVPVSGYSMSPTFGAGDLLLVDRGVNSIPDDGIYVFQMAGRVSIKRLQPRPDGSVLVVSDNPKYEPVIILPEKAPSLDILGRVLYCWSGKRL